MSTPPLPPLTRRPSRGRPRLARGLLWALIALAGLAVAFALGQVIAEGPGPAGTQTIDRTVSLVTVTVRR